MHHTAVLFNALALRRSSEPPLGVAASRCPAVAFLPLATLIYALPPPNFAVRRFALPSLNIATLRLC